MRARGAGPCCLLLDPPLPKVNPTPPRPAPPTQTSSTPHASSPPRLVKGGLKNPGRPPFMRGALLLMAEHFNDWDLQAVVRSCRVVAHPDPPPAAGAAHPRGAQRAEPDQAEAAPAEPPTTPAAARGEARAAAVPAAAAAQGHERAPAVASSKGGAAAALSLYDLEYLDLDHKPFLLPVTPPPPRGPGDEGREREVMISFPAAAASTSGAQQRAVPPGRRAGARTPRPKRSKKSQLKKVVREMPVADGGASSSDPWAWRKYGQKPIKGSPYPRGYYKCSSMKGCMARKLVERSPAKPGVLIVTYMAEHCHPVPTQLNALAGTTRHKSAPGAATTAEDTTATASSSPRSHELGAAPVGRDGAEDAARCGVDGGGGGRPSSTAMGLEFCAEEIITAVDDENELWPEGMDLDELLAPVDDDFDFEHVVDDEDAVLGRRLSL